MNSYFGSSTFRTLSHVGVFILISLFLVATISISEASAKKWHPLETYYVKYNINEDQGIKEFGSYDYGNKQCWIEKSKTTIMGHTQEKNEKVITYIEDGEQWIITINLSDDTGNKMKNPMFKGIAGSMQDKDPKEINHAMLKQMGGQKKAQKKVNNEECTEWTLLGGAYTCITPDLISVESGANMAGISMSEVAIEVKRNNPGPDGLCDIGNAKIKEVDLGQMMGQ